MTGEALLMRWNPRWNLTKMIQTQLQKHQRCKMTQTTPSFQKSKVTKDRQSVLLLLKLKTSGKKQTSNPKPNKAEYYPQSKRDQPTKPSTSKIDTKNRFSLIERIETDESRTKNKSKKKKKKKKAITPIQHIFNKKHWNCNSTVGLYYFVEESWPITRNCNSFWPATTPKKPS